MDDDFVITVYIILAEICQEVIGEAKYKPKMKGRRNSAGGDYGRPLF